jgi:hypothetical protein
MFRPLRVIFRWDIQLDVFKDYFYYNGSVARTQLDVYMLYAYIGTSTRGPQYMLSNLVQI